MRRRTVGLKPVCFRLSHLQKYGVLNRPNPISQAKVEMTGRANC